MIDAALTLLKDQLNAFVVARDPSYLSVPPAVLSDIVSQGGEAVIDGGDRATRDNILISLVNIDEETVGKSQSYYRENPSGTLTVQNPALQLNLYVLFSAHSGQAASERYGNCLKLVSFVARFFQLKHVFTPANTPGLPAAIERLVAELMSPSFEEQNHLWGALGAKYMPSLVYRVRMLAIREIEDDVTAPLIEEIDTNLGRV